MTAPHRRGPERYRVTVELIVEAEHPDELPAHATRSLTEGDIPMLPGGVDMIGNSDEAALQWLIEPERLLDGLPGVAFVEGRCTVEMIEPPPLSF